MFAGVAEILCYPTMNQRVTATVPKHEELLIVMSAN